MLLHMYRKCYAKIEHNSQKTSRSYRFISGLYIKVINAFSNSIEDPIENPDQDW